MGKRRYDPATAALMVGTCRATIYRAIQRGDLRAHRSRIGGMRGRLWIDHEDLEAYERGKPVDPERNREASA